MQSKGAAQEEAWPAKPCSEAHLARQTQSARNRDGRGSCQLASLYPWGSGVAGSLEASVSPQERSVRGVSCLYSWLKGPVLKHSHSPEGPWHIPGHWWGEEQTSRALITGHLGGKLHILWVPWGWGCPSSASALYSLIHTQVLGRKSAAPPKNPARGGDA